MTQRSELNQKFFDALTKHKKDQAIARSRYNREPYVKKELRSRLTATGQDPKLVERKKQERKAKKSLDAGEILTIQVHAAVGKATRKVLDKVIPKVKTSPKTIRRKAGTEGNNFDSLQRRRVIA